MALFVYRRQGEGACKRGWDGERVNCLVLEDADRVDGPVSILEVGTSLDVGIALRLSAGYNVVSISIPAHEQCIKGVEETTHGTHYQPNRRTRWYRR